VEKILVVDDEQSLRDVLSIMLKRAGYAVTSAMDGEEAIEFLNKEIFDLVITDLRMPKLDGMEVLKAVKSASPETVVLIITAFATADSAVEAMKQGAYDYLTKPFQVDEVQLIIRNALEKRRLTTENILLKREMASQSSFAQLVGQSEAMQKVFDVVRKVADSKSNVLICGESGTGKELVARAIHYNSARSVLPFVAVNCSAVPETLLESELFGHMKGSFTGAISNKAGLFEIANGEPFFSTRSAIRPRRFK
jgi:two-component system response regulator PilR (NtrC family)